MAVYTYDGCCGSCQYMNTNDYVGSKDHCRCTYRGQYYDLRESKCSYYRYDPNKDYYDLNHRWYIVGAICKKLGLSDDYECVNLLHNFRVNVLEKDEKYQDMLKEYDMIGPFLAQMIFTDEESSKLCERLLQVYLIKVLDLIKDGKNDAALSFYVEMVNVLRTIYNVDEVKKQNRAIVKSL